MGGATICGSQSNLKLSVRGIVRVARGMKSHPAVPAGGRSPERGLRVMQRSEQLSLSNHGGLSRRIALKAAVPGNLHSNPRHWRHRQSTGRPKTTLPMTQDNRNSGFGPNGAPGAAASGASSFRVVLHAFERQGK